MTDIVERLRVRWEKRDGAAARKISALLGEAKEAADEIERLRSLTAPQLHQHGGGVEAGAQLSLIRHLANYTTERNWDDNRLYIIQAADRAIDALAQQPLSVPEGYALIPIEPTREMWAAMADTLYGYKNRHHDKVAGDLYAAMLAAAPTHPTQSDVSCSRAREGGTGE